jgi:hypothetical protein
MTVRCNIIVCGVAVRGGKRTQILRKISRAKLPMPPFAAEERKAVAGNVYAQVWQQAMNGELAKAA